MNKASDSASHCQSDTSSDVRVRKPFASDGDPYPFEPFKLLLALILFSLSGFLNGIAVSYAHQFAVNYLNYTQPLEDSAFRLIPIQHWAWKASDYGTGATSFTAFLILMLHRWRSTLFRRIAVVVTFLYLLRSITLITTFLPAPFPNAVTCCLPAADIVEEPMTVLKRAFLLLVKFGSSSDGHAFMCGDTIFSGHTMITVVSSWFVCRYAPHPINLVSVFLVTPLAVFSICCIVLSRQHYTVDIVVAIFITLPVLHVFDFWLRTKRRKYVTGWRCVFYPLHNLLIYFEYSTPPGPLLDEISWPLPWPAAFVAYFQSLNRIPLHPPETV